MRFRGRQTQFYIDVLYGIAFSIGFGYLLFVNMDPRVAAFQGGLVLGYFLRVWENMSIYERILAEEVAVEAEEAVAEEIAEQIPGEAEEQVAKHVKEQVHEEVTAEVEEQVPSEVASEVQTQVGEEVEDRFDEAVDARIEQRVAESIAEAEKGREADESSY